MRLKIYNKEEPSTIETLQQTELCQTSKMELVKIVNG